MTSIYEYRKQVLLDWNSQTFNVEAENSMTDDKLNVGQSVRVKKISQDETGIIAD